MRHYNLIDKIIGQCNTLLALSLPTETLATTRANPALHLAEPELTPGQMQHACALMRINHAGEMAAQGLYQGQALSAKQISTEKHMQQAALEEIDHLAWCRDRLNELGGRTSYLDPAWYVGAVIIGAAAGALGDKWSLGFIAETENQVSQHLENHLSKLPEQDKKSMAILHQMKTDEEQHAQNALQAGAAELPQAIKFLMRLASKIMVKTAYHI